MMAWQSKSGRLDALDLPFAMFGSRTIPDRGRRTKMIHTDYLNRLLATSGRLDSDPILPVSIHLAETYG
jgi:hypothetical protein